MPATTPEKLKQMLQDPYFIESIQKSSIIPHILRHRNDTQAPSLTINLWAQCSAYFPLVAKPTPLENIPCFAIQIQPQQFFTSCIQTLNIQQDAIDAAIQVLETTDAIIANISTARQAHDIAQEQARIRAQEAGVQPDPPVEFVATEDMIPNYQQRFPNQYPQYQTIYTLMVQHLLHIIHQALTRPLSHTNYNDIQLFYYLLAAVLSTEEHRDQFHWNYYLHGTTLRQHYIQRFEGIAFMAPTSIATSTSTASTSASTASSTSSTSTDERSRHCNDSNDRMNDGDDSHVTSTSESSESSSSSASASSASLPQLNEEHVPVASLDTPVSALELLRIGRGYRPCPVFMRIVGPMRNNRKAYEIVWSN